MTPTAGAVASVEAVQPLVTGMPFGGAPAPGGQPGSTPTEPQTQVGQQPAPLTGLAILWPDGTRETVATDGMLSSAEIAAVISTRARVEGRSPVSHRTVRRLASRAEDTWGTSWCNYSLVSPFKASSNSVATEALVNCSSDVDEFNRSLGLYRSANYTYIGSDNEEGDSGAAFYASGGCLSSTWQYNSYLYFQAVSDVNGANDFGVWSYTEWISC